MVNQLNLVVGSYKMKVEDFVWVFEAFLEAMDGLHPTNIITDQDGAMRSTILATFPNSCHRNCRWHIMQNFQPVLGNDMAKNEDLRREFNEIIDHIMTKDEFERRWAEMIIKYNVGDNTHLKDVYDLRSSFVPAYFRDRFFPFLQTTARSEGFNAVLKRYVRPHNSLVHFFRQYMKLQEKIEVAEDGNEFEMEEKTLRMWGEWPLEKQAIQVYTRPIYLRFRAEIRKVTSYNANLVEGHLFDVVPITGSVYGYGKRSYRVEANMQESTYTCECSKIKRDGLLCCHALRVMAQVGAVGYIPPHYILPRWQMPPDDIVTQKVDLPDVPSDRKLSIKERKLIRYGTLCNDFTGIAKVASESDKSKAIADKYMLALSNELKSMKLSEAAKRKAKQKKGGHVEDTSKGEFVGGNANQKRKNTEQTSNWDFVGDDGQGSASQQHNIRDPTVTRTKGRPGEKRKKSGLHIKSTKPMKCSGCGSENHTLASCPSKLSTAPEPTEINFFRNMV
jgi:hypothetical protein